MKTLVFKKMPYIQYLNLEEQLLILIINWTDVSEIADKTYKNNDRTRIAIKAGLELLKRTKNRMIKALNANNTYVLLPKKVLTLSGLARLLSLFRLTENGSRNRNKYIAANRWQQV